MTQVGLELTIFCLRFPNAGITGVCHYVQLSGYYRVTAPVVWLAHNLFRIHLSICICAVLSLVLVKIRLPGTFACRSLTSTFFFPNVFNRNWLGKCCLAVSLLYWRLFLAVFVVVDILFPLMLLNIVAPPWTLWMDFWKPMEKKVQLKI